MMKISRPFITIYLVSMWISIIGFFTGGLFLYSHCNNQPYLTTQTTWQIPPNLSDAMRHFLTHGCLKINQIDLQTIILVPGIGKKKGVEIVAYVKSHNIVDLNAHNEINFERIRGIGSKTAARIKTLLCSNDNPLD